MAIRIVRLRVASSGAGRRLDDTVRDWLSRELQRPLSRSAARTLIMAGTVRVNGRPARRPGLVLDAASTWVEAHLDMALLERRASQPTAPERQMVPAVLYEDDDILAIAKPPRLVMHATADASRPNLFAVVRALLLGPGSRETADLPYLGLHHRLDVETSGVVLFTKRERANGAMAEQFARAEVRKIYHAIATKRAEPAFWRVDNLLAASGKGRKSRMQAVEAGGAPAATAFSVLAVFPDAMLVEARPETGRKHQIRAHLAGSRIPILGDGRYGGAPRAGRCTAPRVMLHARSLAFRHPVNGTQMTIECPYPDDFDEFLACVRSAASAPSQNRLGATSRENPNGWNRGR